MPLTPTFAFQDEPTTGLDANTSLEVMTAARSLCTVVGTPLLVSLLQPSPEVCFETFSLRNTKVRHGRFAIYSTTC